MGEVKSVRWQVLHDQMILDSAASQFWISLSPKDLFKNFKNSNVVEIQAGSNPCIWFCLLFFLPNQSSKMYFFGAGIATGKGVAMRKQGIPKHFLCALRPAPSCVRSCNVE